MADRYRKRPVEIEAVQLRWSTWNEVCEFLGDVISPDNPGRYITADEASDTCGEPGPEYIAVDVQTVHGDRAVVRHGDWIIPEATPGRFYPCKPDVFAATYEPVAAEPAPPAGEPETLHFIGLIRGLHATAHLTATADDGRITRSDGRGPWEPIHAGDTPTWFRVPREIAERWTEDDELDDEEWDGQ